MNFHFEDQIEETPNEKGIQTEKVVCKETGIQSEEYVFSRVKECTLLQCFAHGCVGICRVSYFDSVRDYLLSGI